MAQDTDKQIVTTLNTKYYLVREIGTKKEQLKKKLRTALNIPIERAFIIGQIIPLAFV